MRAGAFAVAVIGVLAIAPVCEAQHITEETYCGYRVSRPREGHDYVVMRVDQTKISSDPKCPVMEVSGKVLRRIAGRLKRNDPVRFEFPLGGEGTCYPSDGQPDAFIPDLRQQVVVLTDGYGGVIWMETVEDHDRRDTECREPSVVQVR